jgi:hypothetical protein
MPIACTIDAFYLFQQASRGDNMIAFRKDARAGATPTQLTTGLRCN